MQDLCNRRLAGLGRLHTAEQAREAYLLCRDYFPAVALDLMTALPGQTTAQLLETLAVVCDWGPQHLSLYGLIVEEGTALAAQVEAGQVQLPDEDEVLAMFLAGRRYLQARGYEHYEIANYALPGYRCRHNAYWQNRPLDLSDYLAQLAAGQLPGCPNCGDAGDGHGRYYDFGLRCMALVLTSLKKGLAKIYARFSTGDKVLTKVRPDRV